MKTVHAGRRVRSSLPFTLATLALLAGLAPGRTATACSICRCGDATFNALGKDVYSSGRFRIALDWERFEKENAVPAEDGEGRRLVSRRVGLRHVDGMGRDEELESRFTATLSYGFSDRVNVVARVPFSSRDLTSTGPDGAGMTVKTEGLSDPELYALVRLWSTPFTPGFGRRTSLSASVGAKTAWGRNDLRGDEGGRLDEHAQTGTGSTDLFAGLSGLHLVDESSAFFASVQYRRTGTNDFAYRYGRVTLANVAYERKLSGWIDSVVELNWRHAEQDVFDVSGNRDENTGGDVLYLTPRVLVDLGAGLVGRLTIQIPIVRSLYGDQTEHAVVNAGVTYLF